MSVTLKQDSISLREVSDIARIHEQKFDKLGGQLLGDLSLPNATIDAINRVVNSGTVVNVFVYDTSKDKDGGAWTTQSKHTSWYNETLNTATRGSTRDFPRVALIVAEAATVTIYDATDSTLPMWMVFNATNNGNSVYATSTVAPISSVDFKNGSVYIGAKAGTGNGGFTNIHFKDDMSYVLFNTTGIWYAHYSLDSRNDNTKYILNIAPPAINLTNRQINALAITIDSNGDNIVYVGCIVGDSQIMLSDGTTKLIKDFKGGELVKTFEGEQEVVQLMDQGKKETIELEFDNGKKIKCTPNHPIHTTVGYVEAQYITEEYEVIGL